MSDMSETEGGAAKAMTLKSLDKAVRVRNEEVDKTFRETDTRIRAVEDKTHDLETAQKAYVTRVEYNNSLDKRMDLINDRLLKSSEAAERLAKKMEQQDKAMARTSTLVSVLLGLIAGASLCTLALLAWMIG